LSCTKKDFNKYDLETGVAIPNFEYQDKNDYELNNLRIKYNFDSIKGSENEIFQIINLMKWVHNRVKHNGDNGNVKACSSEIIEYYDKTGNGVNCRLMAILLNEVYLAAGFKSRIVYCMQHPDYGKDSHVTNLVYCDSLKKWIYMDASFNAYITNKNGVIMNHSEIRKALINNEPMKLNNGLYFDGGQNAYLKFMKYRLFRFSSPLISTYGYENNNDEVTFIHLNPLGYKEDKIKYNEKIKDGNRVYFYLQNENIFWN